MAKRKDGTGYTENITNLLKPKAPPKVKKMRSKADMIFSKYIRYRDGRWTHETGWETLCITCGEWKPYKIMQNGHFVSRAVNELRFDEQNCNGQCYACNVIRHGNLYIYGKELDKKYGEGTAEALYAQRFTTHRLNVTELQEIIDKYEPLIAEYRRGRPEVVAPSKPVEFQDQPDDFLSTWQDETDLL